MLVNGYFQTQKDHETCAALVADEMRNWTDESVTAKPVTAAYAVGVRLLSAAYFGKWVVVESLAFIPKMAVIGINLLHSKEAGLNKTFYQKVLQVYWKAIRALLVEASIFAGACIAPELVYGTFQLHKFLFHVELNAFIATMPDFPHVDKIISDEFPEFTDFAWLWTDWKLDNSIWKNALLKSCEAVFKKGQIFGSTLLNRDSLVFKKILFSQVVFELARALNQFQEKGTLTAEKLENMTPFACIILFNHLNSETQKQILFLSPALEHAFENETAQQIALFEVYVGQKFRAPHTTQLCHILLEQIKNGRDALLKEGIYTVDEVEDCVGSSYAAIVSLGIYHFIENAELLELDTLRMTAMNGLKVHLRNDQQFFSSRKYFLELKNELLRLNEKQKQVLFERLYMNEEYVKKVRKNVLELYEDTQVTRCFQLIGRCKSDIVETKAMKIDGLCKQDTTPWNEAFIIN